MQRSDARSTRRRGLAFLAVTLGTCVAACSKNATREPLPDWTSPPAGGTADGGGGAEGGGVPNGTFGITVPATVAYPTRLRVLGTTDQPCAIPLSGAMQGGPANIAECVLDMDELDLFVQGLAFDIHTPQGGCDYVLYEPYLYASWPSGTGPTAVAYTQQPDGTFSDEVNSQNGEPTCAFDFRRTVVGGPNCCAGTYTLTITSAQTGKSTTKVANWGGVSPDCYDGAAFLLDGVKLNPGGYPQDPIYFVHGAAQRLPIRHTGLSDKYPPITVPLANHVDDAPTDAPLPIALTTGVARSKYTISCLDNADEVLGTIRLDVREWNEKPELARDGNPNTTGIEPTFNGPVNDLLDWADLVQQRTDYTRVVRGKSSP